MENKIIVACDVSDIKSAVDMARDLSGMVCALKVGLEFITSCGGPQVVEAMSPFGKIFFDAKFKDIPNTVAGASKAATSLGVFMFNVHCIGGEEMLKASVKAADEESKKRGIKKPLVIGVTVLTSLDAASLAKVGFNSDSPDFVKNEVVRLALLAKECGLDGVVASPKEIEAIKKACGDDFVVVTPGIRPAWAAANDQKRITTPSDAIKMGADYLVIGRPITDPPKEIGGRKEAAKRILEEINT